jgi:predicted RNase H-like HicB family nuclease
MADEGQRRCRNRTGGWYARRPELKGCQSQGRTVAETLVNIREAIELFLQTLPDKERPAALGGRF